MPSKVLKSIARLCGLPPSYPVTPRFYTSPPYLFATPQIVCHRLDRIRDRFVILASDGLWDMLTPNQAVCVVAQHYLDYHGVRPPTPTHTLKMTCYRLITSTHSLTSFVFLSRIPHWQDPATQQRVG